MRVLVVGGYGLIGAQVVARLLSQGHQVVGAGRAVSSARRRLPSAVWIDLDMGRASDAEWAEALSGIDAVVNCAGALQDGPTDDLQAVHQRGLQALIQACAQTGIRRLIHISASTIDGRTDAFSATKRAGEAAVSTSALDWVILRPGLVLARSVYGGSALLRGLAGFPCFIPVVHADALVRVVSADDVADAVVRALRPDAPVRAAVDLVSAEATTLGDLLRRLRGWLGLAPAPIVSVPPIFARLTGHAADALAWLGWRGPLRTTALSQLAGGVDGRPEDAARLGLTLRPLAAVLEASPASVQDHWHARLYFLKPAVLAGLALFWLASGVVGALSFEAAVSVLTNAGMTTPPAQAGVLAGVVADVALGLMLMFRRSAPLALKGMVLVTGAYLLGATVWAPGLWADPLGPLVKTLPAALLALCALALLEER